jgi:hypothetical protein
MILPLLLLAALAPAQQTAHVRRGTLENKVRVTGTVVPADVFRLKSTIEGRVEAVLFTTNTWSSPKETLGFLASKELTAIVDARGSQARDVLEERWQRVYTPTAVRCPRRCFLLKSYIKPQQWVKPRALLVEAAKGLQLVARVRPEDAQYVRDGMEFTFWSVSDPNRVFKGRVANYVLDIQGEKVDPGASFVIELDPERWFPPGTEWEGLLIPNTKKNVLMVPTGALLQHEGEVYLPIKVSTGITTSFWTELTGGVDSGRKILVVDDAKLRGVQRHVQEMDVEALNRRVQELEADGSPKAVTVPSADPPPREKRRGETLPDPDANLGDDPYAE